MCQWKAHLRATVINIKLSSAIVAAPGILKDASTRAYFSYRFSSVSTPARSPDASNTGLAFASSDLSFVNVVMNCQKLEEIPIVTGCTLFDVLWGKSLMTLTVP